MAMTLGHAGKLKAIRKSFWPLLFKLSGAIIAFGLAVFLARSLGAEKFGIYSLFISAVMVISIPIQSGIPTLATRETSKAIARGDSLTIASCIVWSNRLIAYYAVVVFVFVVMILLFNDELTLPGNYLLGVVAVGSLSLTLRNSAVLRGLGRFSKGSSPEPFIRPSLQVIFLALIWLVTPQELYSVTTALAVFVAASFFAFLISSIWLRRTLIAHGITTKLGASVPKEWRRAVIFLTFAGGGQILFGHIDTLMLGVLGNKAEVGAYRVAVQISMLLIFILTVVNQILQPKFAQLFQNKKMDELQQLAAETSMIMFFMALAIGALLLKYSDLLLLVVFGEEYLLATLALQFLVIGQLINVFFGSVGTILNMTGLEREAMIGIVVAIISNLLLDFVLIPPFGMNGAAIASAISIAFWNAISRYYVKKKIGIESSGIIFRVSKIIK